MALEQILQAKHETVRARMQQVPLAAVEQAARAADAPRGLLRSLRAQSCGFILECKKAAPSAGVLRSTYDPAALARNYTDVASGISVLTDGPFFGGALEHLEQVRAAVPQPVLCKDFVIDPYQIYEARSHGADAILLMLSVLDQPAFERCLGVVRSLGMDALVEVHDEHELQRALAAEVSLVGVNNRNLKTLAVDLEVTERLAARVPPQVTLISESGIRTREDVRRLRPQVDGFLIGSSLMRRDDLARAARELVYGRVKVCGLTRSEDARAAWSSGACWGGLIFAPSSPRCVIPEQAMAVREAVPELRWAGVFVNEAVDTVARRATDLRLDAVQLHGEESADTVHALRSQLPEGCELWRVASVSIDNAAATTSPPLATDLDADRVLVDSRHAGQSGGTGKRFDWRILDSYPERQRLIVAGGLTPANIAAADALAVWALDVSSGVEQAPGRKSPQLLEQLFAALRRDTQPRSAPIHKASSRHPSV